MVYGDREHFANLFYLTGYDQGLKNLYLLLTLMEKASCWSEMKVGIIRKLAR